MSKSLNSVIIERAIELIGKGWTQNAMARDRDGRKVCPRSNQAVNFCGYGALMRAAWEIGGTRNYSALIRQVSVLFPVLDFVRLNDDGTQTAVIDAMRDKLAHS